MANVLSSEKRSRIVAALVEGNSIRATARMVGCSKNTVSKLLLDLGEACTREQDRLLRNLPCQRVQCDEIWSFVYAKAKNVPEEKRGEFGYGDVWTWTAIDADTKLTVSWLVGSRDTGVAVEFMRDVAGRLANRVQLTTDGHRPYLEAVEDAFGANVDFAVLQKIYGSSPEAERRYSPRRVHRLQGRGGAGRPGPVPRLDLLRRAEQPHDANEHAALHPPDQRLL